MLFAADLSADPGSPHRDGLEHREPANGVSRSAALGFALAIAACAALLGAKALLIPRLNINWDEFYFLYHVHEALRGDLTLFLQGAYAHLFRWLPGVSADEIQQINIARSVMWLLLVVTALLIYRLARVWVGPAPAAIAPLCYLAMSPVIQHGASYRSDSMLAPLTVLMLLYIAREPVRRRNAALAGLTLGVAMAISLKAALLLPVAATFLVLSGHTAGRSGARHVIVNLIAFGAIATVSCGVLLLLHRLSLEPSPASAGQYAQAAFQKMFRDLPFFPRRAHYDLIRHHNNLAWLLIYGGALCALLQKKFWRPGAAVLSLAPILFYRNAWPYYYVVILAPASLLAALAAHHLQQLVRPLARFHAPALVAPALVLMLISAASFHVRNVWAERQQQQRSVIAAVHTIFPEPVAYIDHSGMVASFPKANFFMSTWGIEDYRARGESFVEAALNDYEPPLLLVNRPVLNSDTLMFKTRLLKRDQELLQRFYQPYWGPIRIAGVRQELRAEEEIEAQTPFAGEYRIVSDADVVVDGVLRHPGDVIGCLQSVRLRLPSGALGTATTPVALIWAGARKPPAAPPPSGELYDPLVL